MNTRRLVAPAVWLTALILYIGTAGPSIVELFDDSLEFQLTGPTLGIAHPTGYPLYTLLGALWSQWLLPVGNWAWRMNIFSAVSAATAVFFIFLLGSELGAIGRTRSNVWAGLGAATAYALVPTWWSQATIAEVYALHGLFVAVIMWVAFQIGRAGAVTVRSDPGAPLEPGVASRMTLLFLLLGFGLTHHRTTLLLLPGLAVYLIIVLPGIWRPRRVWWRWSIAFCAPLLLYTVIPIRAGMGISDLNGSYVNSWPGFWDHVLARNYALFLRDNPLAVDRYWLDWITVIVEQFGVTALLLSLLGLGQFRFHGAQMLLVLLVLAANLAFAVSYQVPDVVVFLLPVFLAASLLAGAGISTAGHLLKTYPRLALGSQLLLVLLLVVGVGGRGPGIDRHDDWHVHNYAVEMAKVDFPAESRVVALEGEATALRYMQQAEGLGHAATPVVADDPQKRLALVEELLASGYPVYLTRELAGLSASYGFSGHGPLVRVWSDGEAQIDEPTHTTDLAVADDALQLVGFDLEGLDQPGDSALRITYYWRPQHPLQHRLKLSLRLLGEDGLPLEMPDGTPMIADRFPLRQIIYTDQWPAGVTMRDVHTLNVPDAQLQDAAILRTIVYDMESVNEVGRWDLELPSLVNSS